MIDYKTLKKKKKEFFKIYFNKKLSDQEKLDGITKIIRFLRGIEE
ncbi:unnamed protein product [marine sediment metagenome]|uniref:Uncharacterized protein n=1 Tax=marine sediment metagenome TaxID=412755 RepID=X0UAJ2_9ZZZZ